MSLKVLQYEKKIHEQLKSLRYEQVQLRMKILCDHAFFKKLLIFQERLTNALMKRTQDQMLELCIQVSESLYQFHTLGEAIGEKPIDPQELKREISTQLKNLESKMTAFLGKVFDLTQLTLSSERSSVVHSGVSQFDSAIIMASRQSKERRGYDIEMLPAYLEEMKEESKGDQQQFKTISEVEEYVYQVLHRHRNLRDRKDASLEDLLAVTGSDHSQDLTNRIRQLIYLDNQAMRQAGKLPHLAAFYRFNLPIGDDYSEASSDNMPSIIKETKNFAKLFLRHDEDSSTSNFDLKKVKKIEFSQSIHKDKTEKSLLFTHEKLDQVVFDGSMKNKEFSIDEAKKLLKKVVKGRKTSIQTEQSFEDPGVMSDRRYEPSSLPSTIDDHFANIQVELKQQKKNAPTPDQRILQNPYYDDPKESKENLQETAKRIPQIKSSASKQQPLVRQLPAGQLGSQSPLKEKRSEISLPLQLPVTQPQSQPSQKKLKKKVAKLPENEPANGAENQALRRDQSQQRLVHNPSQINLASKIRGKKDAYDGSNSSGANTELKEREQSQEQVRHLQQQFYQIIQQQRQQSHAEIQQQLNPKASKQQNEGVQAPNHISQLQDKFTSNKGGNQAHNKRGGGIGLSLGQNINSSYVIEERPSMYDDEAILLGNNKPNKKSQSKPQHRNLNESLIEQQQDKPKPKQKKKSMSRKASLPKIGQSFIQESGNQLQVGPPSKGPQGGHSKKTSQSFVQGNPHNISHYQSSAPQYNKDKSSQDGMKRSKSSAGFGAAQGQGSNNKRVSSGKGGPQSQQKMQKSQSNKKYQHLSDVKGGSGIDRMAVIGTGGGGTSGALSSAISASGLSRYKSVKRLIIME